eukprot:2453437-Amphidinium_carterae.1
MSLLHVDTTSQLVDSLTKVAGLQIATKHHQEVRLVDAEVDSETRRVDSSLTYAADEMCTVHVSLHKMDLDDILDCFKYCVTAQLCSRRFASSSPGKDPLGLHIIWGLPGEDKVKPCVDDSLEIQVEKETKETEETDRDSKKKETERKEEKKKEEQSQHAKPKEKDPEIAAGSTDSGGQQHKSVNLPVVRFISIPFFSCFFLSILIISFVLVRSAAYHWHSVHVTVVTCLTPS